MSNAMNRPEACTCGNCPTIRVERGLKPFCQLPRPVTKPIPFVTKEQLQAANPGAAIVRIRGGLGHGPGFYSVVRPQRA